MCLSDTPLMGDQIFVINWLTAVIKIGYNVSAAQTQQAIIQVCSLCCAVLLIFNLSMG